MDFFYSPYLYVYFICLFKIVNLTNEYPKSPKAKTVKPINVIVPAFGNSAGGSESFNFGVTSDILF